jgi:hypothetical protein
LVPVLAWGNNRNGQTTMPALADVAAVAAGQSHLTASSCSTPAPWSRAA